MDLALGMAAIVVAAGALLVLIALPARAGVPTAVEPEPPRGS